MTDKELKIKEAWISVNDATPEEGQRVLVYGALAYTAWFKNGGFYQVLGDISGRGHMKFISHWMYLPEPPNTEE